MLGDRSVASEFIHGAQYLFGLRAPAPQRHASHLFQNSQIFGRSLHLWHGMLMRTRCWQGEQLVGCLSDRLCGNRSAHWFPTSVVPALAAV